MYFCGLLTIDVFSNCILYLYFFFFSSRRRHTRYWRDWSSDVCSSDLLGFTLALELSLITHNLKLEHPTNTFKFSNLLGYYPTIIHRLPPLANLSISQKSASLLLDSI